MSVKILMVEDSREKYEAVVEELTSDVIGVDLEIDRAVNANSAKQMLRVNTYDLMLLDVALPERDGEEPDLYGGLKLLREVVGRTIYNTPTHVIGLTAFLDIYKSSIAEFAKELWSIVYYDPSSIEWIRPIENKILHIDSLLNVSKAVTYSTDICVVAALQDELDPLLNNGWGWTQHDVEGDSTIYYRTEVLGQNSKQLSVVAAKCSAMGMAAASALAVKLGMTFQPKYIAMIGICAGDSDSVQYGDVIAASPVWDYGSGKHYDRDGDSVFQHAPYQINISTEVRGYLERIKGSQDLLRSCGESFSGKKPRNTPDVVFGPLASGAAVVANSEMFQQLQQEQHRKLVGLEMEAYGVLLAAQELPHPQPQAFIIKAVQDYADQDKNDEYRPYACHVSASVLRVMVEKFLS